MTTTNTNTNAHSNQIATAEIVELPANALERVNGGLDGVEQVLPPMPEQRPRDLQPQEPTPTVPPRPESTIGGPLPRMPSIDGLPPGPFTGKRPGSR